ncbi:VanZ family protein [Exiguobacterium chiriqhucha]|uniref:VanZ family protein n=1 Tax=Exiguobacterium chiriqhucha TaxID=1385984 RepID=UPI0038B71102
MITFLFPSIIIVLSFIVFFGYKLKKGLIDLLIFFYCVIFSVYVAALVSLTLFPFPYQEKLIESMIEDNLGEVHNFTPFQAFVETFSGTFYLADVIHLVGNIVLFIPLGFIVSIFFSEMKKKNVILIGLLVSLAIETIQALAGLYLGYNYRSFDVDDLILNVIGTIVGVLIFKLLSGFLKEADLLINKRQVA